MDVKILYKLWSDFLDEYPINRIYQLSLEEYTNPNREDAFIYWIEKRLEKLGSIWGGSAFKFGIYRRQDTTLKKPSKGRIYGQEYAWMTKYGQTEQEAFKTVKERIIEIVEAVKAGNLDIIDAVDFSPAYKWKLAFLYQERDKPRIFPIYKKECLFFHYQAIDPTSKISKVPYSLLYTSLFDRYQEIGDVFQISTHLWKEWESQKVQKTKFWAVPISWAIGDSNEAEQLCQKTEVVSEDVSSFLEKLLSDKDISEGDNIALLIDEDIRAVGILTNTEPGDFTWSQTPVNFPSELVPIPTSEARELDASEIKAIWSKVSTAPDKKDDAPKFVAEDQIPKVEIDIAPIPTAPVTPQNIILFGPPGTGKTYSTIEHALQLVIGKDKVDSMSADTRMRQFRKLQQEDRVEFVTFHQAYGYEEFVEGLRPVLGDDTTNEVRYELHPGVFKRIALKAASEGLRIKDESPPFDALWDRLLKDVSSEEDRVVKSITDKTYLMEVTSRGSLGVHACSVDDEGNISKSDDHGQTASKTNVQLIWDNRKELGSEPKYITFDKTKALFAEDRGSGGGHHYTAIWMAYHEIFNLTRSALLRKKELTGPIEKVQKVLDKSTPGLVDFQFSSASPQYVLIIDEINRGNISKILGELITLLEPEKRLGSPDELKLPLSYSPEHRFAVPPNLHIIGTMNTADRSIALMDVALRRRFTFEELMPDTSVLQDELKNCVPDENFIDLVTDIFITLNNRIRFLYDNDHQLGHAYFMRVRNYKDLNLAFTDRIIPLLQEYFYGAWDKICTVLGCPYGEDGLPLRAGSVVNENKYSAPIIKAHLFEEGKTIGFDHDEYEDRLDFQINHEFTNANQNPEKLLPYFLGILNLSTDEFQDIKTRCETGILESNGANRAASS